MRAATRKIHHWVKRKKDVPIGALRHRMKMKIKKDRRRRVRELVQKHWKGRMNAPV